MIIINNIIINLNLIVGFKMIGVHNILQVYVNLSLLYGKLVASNFKLLI